MAAIAVFLLLAPTPSRADRPPVVNKVNLYLQILGLEAADCEVEIRPGHAECRFEPIVQKVQGNRGGVVRLDPISIEAATRHADRDCAFAITIKEPGHPPRTYRRGLVLKPNLDGKPTPVQNYPCLLSSPSLASREVPGSKTRR
jgi:hypothetical protein